MRTIASLILSFTMLFIPAFAAEHPTQQGEKQELSFSGSYTDVDDMGKIVQVEGTWLFPLGETTHLVGPMFDYIYLDGESESAFSIGTSSSFAPGSEEEEPPPPEPESEGSLSGYSVGGLWEWGLFGDADGLFVGAGLSAFLGDLGDLFDGSTEARLGLKYGSGTGFIKLFLAREFMFAADEGEDLEAWKGVAGVGLRF